MENKIRGLILAAGKGTRMNDAKPKVLHPILGKPMLQYVIDHLRAAGVDEVYSIVGYGADKIKTEISCDGYVLQLEQLGTGHAVLQAKSLFESFRGVTIIMAGDQPLIDAESIKALIEHHRTNNNHLTLLSAMLKNPYGYGRILREGEQVVSMVEEWDATAEQRLIQEVNISTYCFDNQLLFKMIDQLDNNNKKQEYYINDLVQLFHQKGLKVQALPIRDNNQTIGINDKFALAQATALAQEKINNRLMFQGITIVNPSVTSIGPDVQIGPGTIIYPNSVIEGKVVIGKDCRIESSYIRDSVIGDEVTVGPFAHIRNKSIIHNNVRIGNFVEVKKSELHDGVKAAHLTYLGDSHIGKHVNIGCGTITVNYDGKIKHKTIIEANAFIGSNVNLIAPITIGEGAVVAAGSTVTENVPAKSLAIARSRQTTKEGYYANRK